MTNIILFRPKYLTTRVTRYVFQARFCNATQCIIVNNVHWNKKNTYRRMFNDISDKYYKCLTAITLKFHYNPQFGSLFGFVLLSPHELCMLPS